MGECGTNRLYGGVWDQPSVWGRVGPTVCMVEGGTNSLYGGGWDNCVEDMGSVSVSRCGVQEVGSLRVLGSVLTYDRPHRLLWSQLWSAVHQRGRGLPEARLRMMMDTTCDILTVQTMSECSVFVWSVVCCLVCSVFVWSVGCLSGV